MEVDQILNVNYSHLECSRYKVCNDITSIVQKKKRDFEHLFESRTMHNFEAEQIKARFLFKEGTNIFPQFCFTQHLTIN